MVRGNKWDYTTHVILGIIIKHYKDSYKTASRFFCSWLICSFTKVILACLHPGSQWVNELFNVGVSKNRVPQNGWFTMEKPIKNGWFGDTPILGNIHVLSVTVFRQDLNASLWKDKTVKHQTWKAVALRIQICPKISGLLRYSYSGDGIEAINPTNFREGSGF